MIVDSEVSAETILLPFSRYTSALAPTDGSDRVIVIELPVLSADGAHMLS